MIETFTDAELTVAWGSSRAPAALDRAGRVALLGRAASCLLRGEPLDSEAAAFLGSALSSWLADGGSLERDFLRVSGPAGSHRTPAWVWQQVCASSSRGEQDAALGGQIEPGPLPEHQHAA
jgi:hypothetical protein